MPKANHRIYDDGVHYVDPAPDTDRHPLRWVVKAFRAADAKTNRRAETPALAIDAAKRYTEQAIEKSPADRIRHLDHMKKAIEAEARDKGQPLTTTSSDKSPASKETQRKDKEAARIAKRQAALALREQQREAREAKARLERFATTHFNCIRANPVAQVWQCVSLAGEKKPIGRRKANGRAPEQAPVRHAKGECAILLGQEPLRDDRGLVVVFPTWQAAETQALELYYAADEEERIFWQEPDGKVVARTVEVEVIFDPDVNGSIKPFNLWFYKHNKPYYRSSRAKTFITPAKDAAGYSYQPKNEEERAAHDFNRKLERLAQEDNRSLSMEVAKFRTIWEAEAEAIRLEKEYFNNAHLY